MSTKWLTILLVVALSLIPSVLAVSRSCTTVLDPPRISQSTRLCANNYARAGISITADNVMLDCGTGVLKGDFKNAGIIIQNRKNITLKDCQVANYDVGILVKNSNGVRILNANLIRNMVGIKLIDSSSVIVENSFDISIKKPVQLINAVGNVFHYKNKRLEGDQCRLNQCNAASGIAANEHALAKEAQPKKALRRILNDIIRSWLAA